MKKTCALFALVLLASCGEDPPAPPPVVAPPAPPPVAVKPAPPKPNLAPPLSDAQRKAVEAAFVAARELVKKARDFKGQGEQIEKSQSRQAANDTYVKARDLYRQAEESTEDWIEPELGKVTEGQVKDYLENYRTERGHWVSENASMGKLHKD